MYSITEAAPLSIDKLNWNKNRILECKRIGQLLVVSPLTVPSSLVIVGVEEFIRKDQIVKNQS